MKIEHESSYALKRAEAYPSVQSQLDSLWHSMADGSIPKAEPFFSDIQRVKDQHPKPE